MICVCKNYCLTANSNSYILKKAHVKRNGEVEYDSYSYYPSLESALNSAMRYAARDGVASGELTELKKVISEIQRTKAEVKSAVAGLDTKTALEKLRTRNNKTEE